MNRGSKSACKKSTKKSACKKSACKKSSFGSSGNNNHLSFGMYSDLIFDSKTSSFGNSRFTSGFKSRFGALEVPYGMNPVSDYRKTDRPLAIMPFGPSGPWMMDDNPAAGSSSMRFGNSLEGRNVNPAGYLSTWNGQPRVIPASWNPLLLQGHNTFIEGVNSPNLSNVVSFGKRSSSKKASHVDATNSKGWGKVAKKLNRKELPKSCFLGKGMKFPVCDSNGQVDCRGVLAAMQRSRKGTKVHKKAKALGKKLGCAWA